MRALIYISLILGSLSLWGQETTIIHDFGGKDRVNDPSSYKLVSTSERKVLVYHYEHLSDQEKDELIAHIIEDIDYYMEDIVVFEEKGLTVGKSDKQILKDMESIVSFNVALYDYKVDEVFNGFSTQLQERLKSIALLNWDRVKEDEQGSFDSMQMAYNYLRSQLNGVMLLAEQELRAYADDHIHEFDHQSPWDEENPMDIDTVFEKHMLLPARDYTLEALVVEDISLPFLPEMATTDIPIGTDPDLVELVKSNNQLIRTFGEQMLLMQKELLEIKKEGLSYQEEFRSIREELQDLQVAIEELKEDNQNNLEGRPSPTPVREGVAQVIRFEKNSEEISTEDQLRLNDIYYRLMTTPEQKVMITGFADRSGDTELNAAISRRRALAVKNYLKYKGVKSERLVINFLGDTYSESENPMDRKVEIAWLNP